jgi:hypothetical protein
MKMAELLAGRARTDVAWLPEVIASVVVQLPATSVAVDVTRLTTISSVAI